MVIWLSLNADGTDKTRLVPDIPGHLEWSPDGKKIAFGHGFINIDGTGKVLFDEGGDARWSPDGTRIAFIVEGRRGRGDVLKVMDLRTGQIAAAAATPINMSEQYSWSPDGKRILYSTWGGGAAVYFGYFVMNIETGEVTRRLSLDVSNPVWTPNGKWILYEYEGYIHMGYPEKKERLWSVEGSDPQWSPNGKKLAFVFTEKFGKEVLNEFIYIINPDGTDKVRIAEGQAPTWWSPPSP